MKIAAAATLLSSLCQPGNTSMVSVLSSSSSLHSFVGAGWGEEGIMSMEGAEKEGQDDGTRQHTQGAYDISCTTPDILLLGRNRPEGSRQFIHDL